MPSISILLANQLSRLPTLKLTQVHQDLVLVPLIIQSVLRTIHPASVMILFKSHGTRRALRLHLLPVSVIMVFILHRLLPPLDALRGVEDTDIIDTSQLSGESLASRGNDSQVIPKILHQVYLGWDSPEMPTRWAQARQRCIHLHPDYTHIVPDQIPRMILPLTFVQLWNQSSALRLVEEDFPWFLSTFKSYSYHVQRADSIRYFILHKFGGVYVDLDQQCEQRLDPLLRFEAFVPGTMTGASGLNNNVMGAVAEHPFFRLAIGLLQSYDKSYFFPYLTIMTSAGPHYLTFMWKKYLRSPSARTEGQKVYRLMPYQRDFGRWENEYFSITPGESWATWDTRLFIWEGNHVFWATVLNLSFLVSFSASLWVCVYKLAVFLLVKEDQK